jgi:methionyl-tRNA synthetase
MKDKISISDFAKLDLRVGKILKIEDIEGADKLYNLTISLGDEKRTILAGIKKHYSKEELLEKKVVIIANLEPRKMKGLVSEGMLLAALSEDESEVIFLTPEKDIKEGSKIR